MLSTKNPQSTDFDMSQYIVCGVCYEEYNDKTNKPLCLDCGHTLCSNCVFALCSSDNEARRKCPFDKHELFLSFDEYPVNYSYLEIIASYYNSMQDFNKKLPLNVSFKNSEGSYRGDYKNVKGIKIRAGYGEMIYTNGEKYVGNWEDDKKEGKGITTYTDGRQYNGNFKNNFPHGDGICTYPTGEIASYEGKWKRGKPFGFGKITYRNGAEVESLFINGVPTEYIKKKNPNGTIFFGRIDKDKQKLKSYEVSPKGDIFYGYFEFESNNQIKNDDNYVIYFNDRYVQCEIKNNIFKGKGKIIFDNQDYYEGDIVDGLREGKGTTKYANGSVYTGAYVRDLREGEGKIEQGKYIYNGEWKNDKKNGNGVEEYENGEKYCGDFQNDKKEGNGVYMFIKGDTYKGQWKNDKMNGEGHLILKNGQELKGQFNDGQYVTHNGGKECAIF